MKFECPNCSRSYWVARNPAYELITWLQCSCKSSLADKNGRWVLVQELGSDAPGFDLTDMDTRVATASEGVAGPQRMLAPPIPARRVASPKNAAFGGVFHCDPHVLEDLRVMTTSFHSETAEEGAGELAVPHNPYLVEALLVPRTRRPQTARRGLVAVAVAASFVLFVGVAAAWIAQQPATETVASGVVAPAALKATATPPPVLTSKPLAKTPPPERVITNTSTPLVKQPVVNVKPNSVAVKRHVRLEPTAPTRELSPRSAKTPPQPKPLVENHQAPTPPPAPKKPKIVWDEVECKLADAPPPECARFSAQAPSKPGTIEPDKTLPEKLGRAMINRGIASVKAFVQGCQVRGFGRGQVVVSIVVRSKGTTERVSVTSSPHPKLSACVLNRVMRAKFDATQHGGTFSYVFSFR